MYAMYYKYKFRAYIMNILYSYKNNLNGSIIIITIGI